MFWLIIPVLEFSNVKAAPGDGQGTLKTDDMWKLFWEFEALTNAAQGMRQAPALVRVGLQTTRPTRDLIRIFPTRQLLQVPRRSVQNIPGAAGSFGAWWSPWCESLRCASEIGGSVVSTHLAVIPLGWGHLRPRLITPRSL